MIEIQINQHKICAADSQMPVPDLWELPSPRYIYGEQENWTQTIAIHQDTPWHSPQCHI